MVVFSEHFPSEKSSIKLFAERQKELERITEVTDKGDYDRVPPTKSVVEIPTKQSWAVTLNEIQRDTQEKLRRSCELDLKIKEIHNMIENVDDLKFIKEPDEQIYFAQNQKSELSSNSETSRASSINDDNFNQGDSEMKEIIHKRVIKLDTSDSSLEISNYKPPQIKPTRASILKSKFNAEKSQRVSAESAQSLQKTVKFCTKSTKKFEIPSFKKEDGRKLSSSVRKILDDAKEKHKAKTSTSKRSSDSINVIDLFLT